MLNSGKKIRASRENLKALPSGEYVPVPSDIVLPSIATALLFVVLRHLFDRYVCCLLYILSI
jgi:hypothetical protein